VSRLAPRPRRNRGVRAHDRPGRQNRNTAPRFTRNASASARLKNRTYPTRAPTTRAAIVTPASRPSTGLLVLASTSSKLVEGAPDGGVIAICLLPASCSTTTLSLWCSRRGGASRTTRCRYAVRRTDVAGMAESTILLGCATPLYTLAPACEDSVARSSSE
jgi:hypothetical protein